MSLGRGPQAIGMQSCFKKGRVTNEDQTQGEEVEARGKNAEVEARGKEIVQAEEERNNRSSQAEEERNRSSQAEEV